MLFHNVFALSRANGHGPVQCGVYYKSSPEPVVIQSLQKCFHML